MNETTLHSPSTNLRRFGAAALAALLAPALLGACMSASVQTFGSPEEATAALIDAAATGDMEEAERIFNSFARSSVERDRVYASLFDAAERRYESGDGDEAANLLALITTKYPNAVAAREALAYSLLIERAERGKASPDLTERMMAAIDDVRASTDRPPVWIDLAATQAAIDAGEIDNARRTFGRFLDGWEGNPSALLGYVEDIDRYLKTH